MEHLFCHLDSLMFSQTKEILPASNANYIIGVTCKKLKQRSSKTNAALRNNVQMILSFIALRHARFSFGYTNIRESPRWRARAHAKLSDQSPSSLACALLLHQGSPTPYFAPFKSCNFPVHKPELILRREECMITYIEQHDKKLN